MIVGTRFLKDFRIGAAAAGCYQVVLLAAGLDMRAFRLSWPDGTTVLEFDRPEVITFKLEVITDHGHEPRCYRVVVEADPTDDWRSPLLGTGLDMARRTAWLAEGLVSYLAPDAKDRLLATITGLSPRGQPARVRPPQ